MIGGRLRSFTRSETLKSSRQRHKVSSAGFTIVESLIFLAVTGLLFVLAANSINGQQAKTEFSQSVRDFHSTVDTIIGGVSNGFFPSFDSLTCKAPSGSKPTFTAVAAGSGAQGTNHECIFLGKVLAFQSGSATYSIFTIAATKNDASGLEVRNFSSAKPAAVVGAGTDLTDGGTLPFGLQVTRIHIKKGAVQRDVGAVGFFSSFGSYKSIGNDQLNSGSSSVVVVPLRSSSLASINSGDVDDPAQGLQVFGDTDVNPDAIVVCLRQDGVGGRRAAVIIGSRGRQTSTELHVGDIDTATADTSIWGGTCPN